MERNRETEKERRERAREIGGWSLTSKQSWVETKGPSSSFSGPRPSMRLDNTSGWYWYYYYCPLLYQASFMSLARVRVIRVVDLGHQTSPVMAG